MQLSFLNWFGNKKQVEFDWKYEMYVGYGKYFRPVIPVGINTTAGWVDLDFLVDTGADITMLPYDIAALVGIDLSKLKPTVMTGIGGFRVKTWKTKIPIRLKDWEFEITASISEENSTPLLLGRKDLLDKKISWIFDHKKEKIIFKR